jgi:hypothetical protein
MPLDFNPSRSPVERLMDFEHAKRHGGLDPVDEERYIELIEVLHKMSDADQGRITEGLFTLAFVFNSPGAARALRGLRLADRRREVVASLEMYPDDPDGKPQASNNLPLILSGTSDVAEIKLLAKCSRFKRLDGSRTPEDIVFCTKAIESLSTIRSPIAEEALLIAVASDNETISNAATWALLPHCSNETRALCRELLALPKREAIKRLAKMEGKGGFAALQATLFDSSRYDRFFAAARTLTNR